ncbi:MAG TPA: SIMPL domain-containing protein [Anaerolineaceae bacterium]|nr:SIMPL domain-containing protein [Anaerolineaceae bacterium]HPN50221.1 SIMPL domain-containing protein [Anaerolineaceae bacterium]
MKHITLVLNLFLAGALFFVLLTAGLPVQSAHAATPAPTAEAQADTSACDASRSVHVSGSAMINVTPDRAMIQLGVVSNAGSIDAVEMANTVAIQKVKAAIQAQGVDLKDISTDYYVVEPVYENYNSLFIKGYRINNTVAVTVREVNKTSAIVSASLAAGANQVNNVEFYTSDLRKYRDQARELAMTAAREKAQALAEAAGAEAGCVLNISENSWSYYNGWWWGSSSSSNLWMQNTVQNASPSGNSGGSGGADEPISLGQISVKAEVDATYALK